MQSTNVTPPETGTLVFSSDGEEIGEITAVEEGYFQIKKGIIIRKGLYVPLSAIVGTALGGEGVQLNISKAELESGDYSEPPTAAETGPVSAEEHNTMGTTTPFGTSGESAEMAATPKRTPPESAESTFGGGDQASTGMPDDTDASQRPETEAHRTDDPTTRP